MPVPRTNRTKRNATTQEQMTCMRCKPIFVSDFPRLSASVLGYSEEHYAHLNNTFRRKQTHLREMKQPKTLNRKPLIIARGQAFL